jgi:hypothetical protein
VWPPTETPEGENRDASRTDELDKKPLKPLIFVGLSQKLGKSEA